MAAVTTLPTATLAETAKELRDVLARMERGEDLSPEAADLAVRLAQQTKHDRVRKAAERVMKDHASILAALAK